MTAKNAWILYDPITQEVVGRGDGQLDMSTVGNAVVKYRDDHDAIAAEASVQSSDQVREAGRVLGQISLINRAQARSAKAICARQFLAEVVPVPVGADHPSAVLIYPERGATPDDYYFEFYVDSSDPNSIPASYLELYAEWWGLFDKDTNATNAWHLAALIVEKATAETITNEVERRREKVIAQMMQQQPIPEIPDE